MELEALKEIDSEVQALGARIVVLTPEHERYTRALHKKLNLPFDILTDLHLKIAEQLAARLHLRRLLARPLQVVRQCTGQVPR
jgi:peroxiredoxin